MRPYGFTSHEDVCWYGSGKIKQTKAHRANRSRKAGATSRIKRQHRRFYKKMERRAVRQFLIKNWRLEYTHTGDDFHPIRLAMGQARDNKPKISRIKQNDKTIQKVCGFRS